MSSTSAATTRTLASSTATSATRGASAHYQLSDGTLSLVASSYKRIIICCDGTWQGSDKGSNTVPSNVARLVGALEPKRHDIAGNETQQIVYYQSGVGTSTFGNVGNVAAGATGGGLDDNVLEAYYFLCNNVEPDDEIFLFGFSRGAYTVRTLAGILDTFDIIDRYSLHKFPEFYAAYKQRAKEDQEFRDMYNRLSVLLTDNRSVDLATVLAQGKIAKYQASIKVIGVFDTVGSMGIPENVVTKTLDLNKAQRFRDATLSSKVENAFHALALDEHRQAFTPTMWHSPPSTRGTGKGPNLVQTWFPGVHINIGGGNSDNKPIDDPNASVKLEEGITPAEFIKKKESWTSWLGNKISSGVNAVNVFAASPEQGDDKSTTYSNADNEQIADMVLMWMIDRCRPYLKFNEEYLTYLVEQHDKNLAIKRKKSVNTFSKLFGGRIDLKFGWGCGPIEDSYTGVMALGGSRIRAPGMYTLDIEGRTVIDETSHFHHTNEYMHPSVRWRYFNNGGEYLNCRGLHKFTLADYTADKDNSPVKDDKHSTGMVWERKLDKPKDKTQDTVRVSEGEIPRYIQWTEIVGGEKIPRKEDSLEWRLMKDEIWNDLRKGGQTITKPISGKWFYQ